MLLLQIIPGGHVPTVYQDKLYYIGKFYITYNNSLKVGRNYTNILGFGIGTSIRVIDEVSNVLYIGSKKNSTFLYIQSNKKDLINCRELEII